MAHRSNFAGAALANYGNDVCAKPFLFSMKEKSMRKSVVLFLAAVAVVLLFILATPYYYSVTPENRGTQPVTETAQ